MADGGPVDLVLEGGGVKGIGLVGATAVLEEAGYTFVRLAGSSAGAIVASLLAAGYPVSEVAERMHRLDLRRFRDPTPLARIPVIGRVASVVVRRGIYRGDELRQWLADELAEQGVRTFGDLRLSDEEAGHLPPGRAWRLVVMVADLSLGRLVRLPWDYERLYGLDPDEQDVALAVRASASIPFYYKPVVLPHADSGARSFLVDGGLLSNFPVEVFDRPAGDPSRWPTFGIALSPRPSEEVPPRRIDNTIDYLRALVATLVNATDRATLEDPCVLARTMFVDSLGVSATDFDIDTTTRRRLEENGREAARRFLARWDEEEFLRTCR